MADDPILRSGRNLEYLSKGAGVSKVYLVLKLEHDGPTLWTSTKSFEEAKRYVDEEGGYEREHPIKWHIFDEEGTGDYGDHVEVVAMAQVWHAAYGGGGSYYPGGDWEIAVTGGDA